MKNRILWITIVSIISCVFLGSCTAIGRNEAPGDFSANGFIGADGKYFVGADGKKIILKGCNLGSWLNQEMWMIDVKDESIPDQYTFEEILEKRFGKAEHERLMDLYRANWIRERDFKIIKSFGFNCVRIPFHYNIIENEDKPMTLRDDAWQWLDHALELAARYDLYVILDLHSAAGCQSELDHSGRINYNKFWSDRKYWECTIWLWEQIAKRYKDNKTIAMYQPINEPWGGTLKEQVEIFDELYQAIRKYDKEHLLSPSGHWSGFSHYGNPKEHGWEKVAYSQNFYPGLFGGGPAIPDGHRGYFVWLEEKIQPQIDKLNIPFIAGEFNVVFNKAGGGKMMRRHYDKYEQLGWAATMWSYKVLTSPGMSKTGGWWFVTHYGGDVTGKWWMVTNKNERPKIDFRKSGKQEIEDYFRSLGTMEYTINEDFRSAMTAKESPEKLIPTGLLPSLDKAPARDKFGDWTGTDINGPWEGGQVVVGNDGLDIYAGGSNVDGTADQFRFIWQKLKGDFELSVKVDSMDFTEVYARSGIMVRKSLDPSSACVNINVIGDGSVDLGWRLKDNSGMQTKMIMGTNFPVRLKLVRKGNVIERYFAAETGEWTNYGDIEFAELGDEAYVGMFAVSHNRGRLTKTKHRDIKLIKK